MPTFVKRNPGAPAGFFACEAAGLQWLSDAEGGVPCAEVIGCDDVSLTLGRLESVGAEHLDAQVGAVPVDGVDS